MREALRANNIEIATEQQFSTNDKDFRAQLTAVRGANVDLIAVSALQAPAISIITQARELGLRQPIAGGNGFNTPTIIQNAGEAAEGVYVGAAWNSASDNPKSQAVIAWFLLRSVHRKCTTGTASSRAPASRSAYLLPTAAAPEEDPGRDP